VDCLKQEDGVVDKRLLEWLVCPLCKGPLQFDKAHDQLICAAEKLLYPIRDGIPVLLADEAKLLTSSDDAAF